MISFEQKLTEVRQTIADLVPFANCLGIDLWTDHKTKVEFSIAIKEIPWKKREKVPAILTTVKETTMQKEFT